MRISVDWTMNEAVPKPFLVSVRQAVRAVLTRFFDGQNARAHFSLGLAFVGEDEMRRLNENFRDKNEPTDVLSFPADDAARSPIFLGDIAICVPVAAQRAAEYGHSAEREIAFLAVHGLLHLLGLDHRVRTADGEIMNEIQEEILQEMGLTR